jgi:hypothetical protein
VGQSSLDIQKEVLMALAIKESVSWKLLRRLQQMTFSLEAAKLADRSAVAER